MLPGKHNLDLYLGDTYKWRFLLWEDEEKTVPFPIAGYTPLAEIRDKSGGELIIPLKTTATAPNIIDMELEIDNVRTQLPKGKGVWDIQLDNGTDTIITFLAGDVSQINDVTGSAGVTP